MSDAYLSSIADKTVSRLMVTVSEIYAKEEKPKTIPKDLMLSLYSVFGAALNSALDLIDRSSVTVMKSGESGREVIKVLGSRGINYTLLTGVHYCPCPSYQYSVIGRGDRTCKHLLAASLAIAMGRTNTETVLDHDINQFLEELSFKPG